jgi:hypothetical protein
MLKNPVQQGSSNSLYLAFRERPRLPFTACINDPAKLARLSSHGMAPVLVPLRPSSEHILIVRAPGARDRHACHSIPFHRARSASKKGTWPLPPAGGLFQHPAIAVHGRRKYHPVHATHLDTYRPTRGALPHRSQYQPAHTGCDGGRPNRMDALSDRISYSSRGPRADRMDLDRNGLRHLWNDRIGLRPRHSHEHPGRTGQDWRFVPLQCDERDRELFIDPLRRARIFTFVPGSRASRIPPSQSSVPFLIRKTLIRSNPASVNQTLVSAAE